MQSKNCVVLETEIYRLRSCILQCINDKANLNYLTHPKFQIDTRNSLALATVGHCCSEIDFSETPRYFFTFS